MVMVVLFFPPPSFVSWLNFLNFSPLMEVAGYLCISAFLEWRGLFIQIAVIRREIIASVFLVHGL